MQLLAHGMSIPLSPLEYRFMAYLIHHKGRVVPPAELIEHLYGDEDARDANALEALVARLRKKLGHDAIETRRGFGYALPGEAA
jgi:DNA-binding response OmpR family regulator